MSRTVVDDITTPMTIGKGKAQHIKTVRALLERHACPVPFYAVRTRLLGNIATPVLAASPLRVVEGLWGGELPEFDSVADAEILIAALVQGLWNDLAQHQKRTQPFRLTRLAMEPTAACLRNLAQVRVEVLDGFIEGLFAGGEEVALPERAHAAVGALAEMRAMFAGAVDLVDHAPSPESQEQLETTFRHLRNLTRIGEVEIHEAVLSCTRARRQMLKGIRTMKPTVH